MMTPLRLVPAALLALVLLPACRYVAAASYLFGPPQVQKAEFKPTSGRLVLLLECARPEDENPVFAQNLHEKFEELLAQNDLKTQVVPREDVLRLRQEFPDFGQWTVQKVGQRLNAAQVLYVRIDRLQLREAPASPLLTPAVQMRLKLIDVQTGERLWPGPQERDGRVCGRSRPSQEVAVGDSTVLDAETAKLGKDAAWVVAQWFYDVDLEQKTPWEP